MRDVTKIIFPKLWILINYCLANIPEKTYYYYYYHVSNLILDKDTALQRRPPQFSLPCSYCHSFTNLLQMPIRKSERHIGCIPFDQISEFVFFNRKLDQIADQLGLKIQKWIFFHTEVSGSRLPWDFWSVVHVIKQSRTWLINQLIKWIQN